MKKMMTTVAVIVGALGVVVTVLALIAPNQISIQTRSVVKASPEEVYDELRYLGHFSQWSPFLVADPAQKNEVRGTDGVVGATFHWEGVAEESIGKQVLTALEPNQRVYFECEITAPYTSYPSFDYSLTPLDDGTEVVQQFEVGLKFPTNIVAMLIGLKGKMSEVNQLGMKRFKAYTENLESTAMVETFQP
ncbi:MAG: SRPBCC family protein [Salibacteraceae bacterium]